MPAPSEGLARGSRRLEAWFLGPRGENVDELERLVVEAVRDHAEWRRTYHRHDPVHITPECRQDPEFVAEVAHLREEFTRLLAFLRRSVPFFSMRHQGHMTWETTLPALAGYFAAMLANPNNVAFEGSPATSVLERWVGDDLCAMLGYTGEPWGHLTSGGSVANLEALWALRNVKFHAAALQAATGRPEGDAWTLFNLPLDEVLLLHKELTPGEARQVPEHTVQELGLVEACARYLKGLQPPVYLTSGPAHHSLEKAAAILGVGTHALRRVEVDQRGRLCLRSLRQQLERCLAERTPVYAVVVNIGSTEVGAIDPLREVAELRRELRTQGLDFAIHADGAWGGYHASLVRDDFPMRRDGDPVALEPPSRTASGAPLRVPLGRYPTAQMEALALADTITVDPHKSGYIPYSAGALCYRNAELRSFTSFTGAYAFHGDVVRNIGIFGVEGSKAGATAAAVYLSHCVIRPSRSGYGAIIGEALFACKLLYARLLCLAEPGDPFRVVPLPKLPEGVDERFVRERILAQDDEELLDDSEVCQLLPELGPDQNILVYAVAFRRPDGSWNTDLEASNRLNRALYDHLSLDRETQPPLILSTTDLEEERFGADFLDDYKTRLLGQAAPGPKLTVLRSVVMDPWVSPFLGTVAAELRQAILKELQH